MGNRNWKKDDWICKELQSSHLGSQFLESLRRDSSKEALQSHSDEPHATSIAAGSRMHEAFESHNRSGKLAASSNLEERFGLEIDHSAFIISPADEGPSSAPSMPGGVISLHKGTFKTLLRIVLKTVNQVHRASVLATALQFNRECAQERLSDRIDGGNVSVMPEGSLALLASYRRSSSGDRASPKDIFSRFFISL